MPVAAQSIPIIILAGQSNANSPGIGQAVFDQVTAQGGWYVHVAVNGSSLSPNPDPANGDWNPFGGTDAGACFQSLMSQIGAMLDPQSPSYVPGAYLEKMVWVQGEADALATASAAAYQQNLTALHAAMTNRFGPHDMVISALSDAAINAANPSEGRRANYQAVQQAQLAVTAAESDVYLVDPDAVATQYGYTPGTMLYSDMIHYNVGTGFAATLGRALMQAGPAQENSAPPASGTSAARYVTGSLMNDRLDMAATGLGQAYGAAGTDTLTLTGRTDGVTVQAGGMDAILVTANGGSAFHLDLVSIEHLVLTAGSDLVAMAASLAIVDTGRGDDQVTGRALDDMIHLRGGLDAAGGGTGNDCIFGGGGADILQGGDGNDVLSGGNDGDQIYGGVGADTLSGGAGNDQLTGGEGQDVFVFGPGYGTDRITDFEDGIDRIVLQALPLTLTITGTADVACVSVGDLTLVFEGVDSDLITTADFSFA